ncbi:SGNH hydrolase domain-containing protein [uncultured Nocardioides sp.]|uniref:SGNH hydrolase domain-containing protein n=1 Tax=uncultured Nocardioides sp. TaxID=198441 RepID=UPI0025D3991C|nr:SGNH hydrolase domain-containing protein [uncultured Nocardioides sp.]
MLLLGACTGEEPPAPPPATPVSPVEVIRALPTPDDVESAVGKAVEERSLPDDLVPELARIAFDGVLSPPEQRCVRDYDVAKIPDGCVMGAPEAERSILLWGDARAAMWIPALTRIAEQTGYRLVIGTQMQCPPLLGLTPWLAPENRPYVECATTNESMVSVIDVLEPEIVVLAGAVRNFAVARNGQPVALGTGRADNTWEPDVEVGGIWEEGLDRTLAAIDDADVFVIGEAPYLPEEPSVCLAAHVDSSDVCGVSTDVGVYDQHDERVRRTTEQNDATYVSPLPWLCADGACPAVIDGYAAYRDTFHLNRQYVLHLSRALGAALELDDWKDLAD